MSLLTLKRCFDTVQLAPALPDEQSRQLTDVLGAVTKL